jgi:integrase
MPWRPGERNAIQPQTCGELCPPVKGKHFSAVTEPADIGALLRAIWAYRGSFVTQCALRLAPLVFVRPGELRNAEWSEIDLDRAEWCIPAVRMKMKEPHLVSLSSQAVAILHELHALTGTGRYVFPSPRTASRPMSNNGVLSALRRMGYGKEEMTGHGFRAMARTALDEVLGFRVDIITAPRAGPLAFVVSRVDVSSRPTMFIVPMNPVLRIRLSKWL